MLDILMFYWGHLLWWLFLKGIHHGLGGLFFIDGGYLEKILTKECNGIWIDYTVLVSEDVKRYYSEEDIERFKKVFDSRKIDRRNIT